MKSTKNLGIWMDHSEAHLIDIYTKSNCCTIESAFTADLKEEALEKSESIMHNKRQKMHESFYKEIGDSILNYNHVLLFGPSNAKTELLNYLGKDVHFKHIEMDVEAADKMTDNQKLAFVRNHFDNN